MPDKPSSIEADSLMRQIDDDHGEDDGLDDEGVCRYCGASRCDECDDDCPTWGWEEDD